MKNMDVLNKAEKVIFDCYVELFKQSTPAADFNKLVEAATINDRGEKEIPFMDYEIEEDLYSEIVERYSKKIRKFDRKAFKITINLGCSPKTKYK